MEVNINDNTEQALSELERKTKLALQAVGTQVEKHAKEECPVDTGRLRNSINYKVVGDAIYVGTNVEYAPAVEYGDSAKHTTGNAHFLEHSVTNHREEYKTLAKKIMS